MLLDKIKQDRKEAMKVRDVLTKTALTTLLGELESDFKRTGDEVTDLVVVAKVKKFIKGINDTLSVTSKNSGALKAERFVYEGYLPKQLSETVLHSIIEDMVASGLTNMGQIMKQLKQDYDGQYDGKLASQIVRSAL